MTKKSITPHADALPLAKHFACSQAMLQVRNMHRNGFNSSTSARTTTTKFAAPTAKSYMAGLPRMPIKKMATKRKAVASAPILTSKAEKKKKPTRSPTRSSHTLVIESPHRENIFGFDISKFVPDDDEINSQPPSSSEELKNKLKEIANRLEASIDSLVADNGPIRARISEIQDHLASN
uniref:DUF1409 domain-containing protein n=1 Tax=Leersia perrieri TaxID=77586 RepID=A0A0D9XRH4_9ORYZ